jgi:hypothetical protein
VTTYPDKTSPIGTQELDFEFRIPEWLPDSTIYTSKHADSIFNIRYGIYAQLTPVSNKNYVDKEKTISIFRCNEDIYIYKSPMKISREINL